MLQLLFGWTENDAEWTNRTKRAKYSPFLDTRRRTRVRREVRFVHIAKHKFNVKFVIFEFYYIYFIIFRCYIFVIQLKIYVFLFCEVCAFCYSYFLFL